MVYDLHYPVPYAVHPLYPQHLVLGFELFSDALTDGQLLYQLKKHIFRLFVDVRQIGVQLAAGQQLRVQGFPFLIIKKG